MINDILLKNFRNYSSLNTQFSNKINVFTGKNGQGKTNLLEAIYFLGLLRSFRTPSVADLRKIGTDGFMLSATIDTGKGWKHMLEVEYSDKRRLRIDASPVYKASEFICQFNIVAFTPSDILIVTQSANLRRRFINMLISSIDHNYLNSLNLYSDALKMRNSLLRDRQSHDSTIAPFESILASNGSFIVNKRRHVLSLLSPEMKNILISVRNDVDSFNIHYSTPQSAENEQAFLKRLAESRHKDSLKGYTSFGPHTDDFDFILNGRSLRHFGSNGFCRLASLALKMAAVNIHSTLSSNNHSIITLVDDVTGDLDTHTTDALLKSINKSEQTFFTFTETPDNSFFSSAAFFCVHDGKVDPQ